MNIRDKFSKGLADAEMQFDEVQRKIADVISNLNGVAREANAAYDDLTRDNIEDLQGVILEAIDDLNNCQMNCCRRKTNDAGKTQ